MGSPFIKNLILLTFEQRLLNYVRNSSRPGEQGGIAQCLFFPFFAKLIEKIDKRNFVDKREITLHNGVRSFLNNPKIMGRPIFAKLPTPLIRFCPILLDSTHFKIMICLLKWQYFLIKSFGVKTFLHQNDFFFFLAWKLSSKYEYTLSFQISWVTWLHRHQNQIFNKWRPPWTLTSDSGLENRPLMNVQNRRQNCWIFSKLV